MVTGLRHTVSVFFPRYCTFVAKQRSLILVSIKIEIPNKFFHLNLDKEIVGTHWYYEEIEDIEILV